ncbi:M48 family metallopeptidase [Patescibacteria group bacterium]|nr:M48 family metallopeptidase [Patescibacteria group bacterium]
MTLYTLAESNIRKTWFYLMFFFCFIIFLGWIISYFLQNWGIFWVALILGILMNFASFWYSDKIVLAMAKAKKIEKRDNPELYRIVENLCITAGLPLPKIYIINEQQPNAFATGRDPKRAAIAVTQGLIDKLDRVELEGVLGHELAHIGNRDMLLATAIVVLVGMVVLMTDFFFRISFWGGGSRRRREGRREGGSILGLIALILAIFAPLFATLIKLAISRKREFLADVSGALLTRYPEGLARALEKISRDPRPLRAANDATCHLYIVNPFRSQERKSWLHKLFMTHPPVEERIRALRGMRM